MLGEVICAWMASTMLQPPKSCHNTRFGHRFAVADIQHCPLLAKCATYVSALLSASINGLSHEGLTQVHLWQTWASLLGADEQRLGATLRSRCRDAMLSLNPTTSRLQKEVGFELSQLHDGVEHEIIEEATGYSLDLSLPSQRVAVEVDGPSHFLMANPQGQYKPTGATALKRRLLTMAGWRVVSIPFFEWDRLASTTLREAHLKRRLAKELMRSESVFDPDNKCWHTVAGGCSAPSQDKSKRARLVCM